MKMAQTALSTNEEVYFKEEDFVRIINIPTFDISATDFDINLESMSKLYNSGYDSAKNFLSNWSFEDYISRFIL